MGFFSDIFDAVSGIVTAPINAITGLVGDVTSGQNVFESVARVAPNVLAPSLGGLGLATRNDGVRDFFSNVPLLGKDAIKLGDYQTQIYKGDRLDIDETKDFLGSYGKGAAVIGAGVVAGSAFGGAAAISGASGAAALSSGNLRGGLQGLAGVAGASGYVPDFAQPFVDSVAAGPRQVASAPRVSSGISTQSGYGGVAPTGGSDSLMPILLVAGVGVVAFMVIKKGKK